MILNRTVSNLYYIYKAFIPKKQKKVVAAFFDPLKNAQKQPFSPKHAKNRGF